MKRTFVALGIIVIAAFVILIANAYNKLSLQRKAQIYDNIHKVLDTTLQNEKNLPLSLAVALSNNREIQDVVIEQNRTKGYRVLHTTAQILKRHSNARDIQIQIFTPGINIFARSWGNTAAGIPIITGRKKYLRHLLKSDRAIVGIDTGLPLGMKAYAPISYMKKHLGLLEVTIPYDDIVTRLRNYHIELIPLISTQFVPKIYIDHYRMRTFGNRFVIASQNSNAHLLSRLEHLSVAQRKRLTTEEFVQTDDLFFASYPMTNLYGIRLGTFIAIIRREDIGYFTDQQQSLIQSIFSLDSTPDDLYHYIRNDETTRFQSLNPKNIPIYKMALDQKEQIQFDKILKQKLQQLSRQELIDLLLYNHRTQKTIEGEIR